ncbi:acetyl-CoA acetyltransferase [Micromonospora sp. WMMA1363]|uniref:acetyl-CoA acetyltransferase n=1 Tax=Micromonospora sp. WMMA1363 TaxID=3053985 RepID=UPI00259CE4BD|nr:acetyl-CoA acetyltransferase [Micromonospora sp. WMMA1363]MDM4719530.1 acetyl-CoA acetyltransferase [Micromonospora sp. WMMA1363]
MTREIYVLGGAQTDFARNWSRTGLGLGDMIEDVLPATFADADVPPDLVEVVHVGNLAGELFAGQAHLGGMVTAVEPALVGRPASRHEAACAAGGTALLAACSDLMAGHYDTALVVGVELMRNVSAREAADKLGSAAWVGREAQAAQFVWPTLFAEVADEYDRRYGLDHQVLGRFAEIAFANARGNTLAQTRDWDFPEGSFAEDDDVNPVVAGRLRKTDCGRITDGAAAVILATREFTEAWAARRGIVLDDVAHISGFGHRTDTLLLADKLHRARDDDYMFPHLRRTVADAFRRGGVDGIEDVDVVELHDCFSVTGLVTLEHLGLVSPGMGGEAILNGTTTRAGSLPVNPGGGLLGLGHPVGATGVRMVLDGQRQVTGHAGHQQIDGARRVLTVNVGGSFTTIVAFVVEAGAR